MKEEIETTPAERVKAVFRGEKPDYVPFTIYETKLAGKPYEHMIRDRGICMIRRIASHRIITPNVIFKYYDEHVDGMHIRHSIYETPLGILTSSAQILPTTQWTLEYIFKGEEDYKKLAFCYADQQITENYDAMHDQYMLDAENGDILVRTQIGSEPMQELISFTMGAETFCYEWMDHRDEVLRLIKILTEKAQQKYTIEAQSPFWIVNYGGNATPEIIGRTGYRDHYMTAYAQAHEQTRAHSKLLGTHLDANNTPIMDLIAESKLDYIEAYDPAMSPSVDVATKMFGDILLSIHFPSAWQMLSSTEIRRRVGQLIDQAENPERLIIGITEDMPEERYPVVLAAIQDGIEAYGRL